MAWRHLNFLFASALCFQQCVVAQNNPTAQNPVQDVKIIPQSKSSDVTSYPFTLSGGTSGDTSQRQSFKGNLSPMSTAAENRTEAFTGPFYVAGTANSTSIPANSITLISCDTSAYPGNLQADDVLQTALSRNVGSIIWFTTTRDLCEVPSDLQNRGLLFTMTSAIHADLILDELDDASQTMLGTITVAGANPSPRPTESSTGTTSPLAPGPTTAVAMIILYCVTAIVTALFLIIIVTGAVRAHRHPERYGRQVDAAGQQRQSRAKGIARAMLDTIPIVKFGERENGSAEDPGAVSKRGDVELGAASTALATDRDAAATTTEATTGSQDHSSDPADTVMTGAATTSTAAVRTSTDEPNEISTAPPVPTAADIAVSVPDDTLGCSICTDDFERGQDIRVLPCDHRFHPACIDPWLLNVSGTCPLCRIDLRDPNRSASDAADPSTIDNDADNFDPPHPTDRDTSTSNPRRRSALSFLLQPSIRMAPYQAHAQNRRSTAGAVASPPLANESGTADDVRNEDVTASGEAETRRHRRITMRLQETFGIRTRRHSMQPTVGVDTESAVFAAPVAPAAASNAGTATNTSAQSTNSQQQAATDRLSDPQRNTSATSASGRPIQMAPFIRSD